MSEVKLINTTDDKKKMYKATQGGTQMQDAIGTFVSITSIMQYTAVNKRTGDNAVCTVLFDKDGSVYTSMSPTIYEDTIHIAEIFGNPSDENVVTVIISEGKSKAGNRFLRLEIA